MNVIRVVFGGIVTLLSMQGVAWCDSYTYTPLAPATPPGLGYFPFGINDSEVTEGVYFDYEPWEMGIATTTSFTELPDFNAHNECSTVTNGCFILGRGITNRGDVAAQRLGYPNNDDGATQKQPLLYFYAKDSWTEVTSPTFSKNTWPTVTFGGMNQSGQITATYGHLTSDPRDPEDFSRVSDGSMLWSNGAFSKIVDPNAPANETMVGGLNDLGEIVGSYGSGNTHGFIDRNGIFHDLNVPGAVSTSLMDVNDAGQIVGSYTDSSGASHLFLYSNGKFTAIGNSGTLNVTGFNNAGEIVGYLFANNPGTEGFVYENGSLQTIEYPGSDETFITGVNNEGVLDGYCVDANACASGFIATPLATATPEPGAFGLLTTGILLAAGLAGRRLRPR